MMAILHEALSFIVAISILVFVHEFGHFWVARRCGVRVLKFSLGFGQTLFSWNDKHGTEYIVAAIPLGGYVKMADEREEPVPEQWLPEAFNRKSVWQRMAIVSAGPIANFLLAFLVFWAANLGGHDDVVPRIIAVEPDSLAAKAGVPIGQEIAMVDGQTVEVFSQVHSLLMKRIGDSGELHLGTREPGSQRVTDHVLMLEDWLKQEAQPNPWKGMGIELYSPPLLAIIGEVLPDTPAARAGIQAGDEVTRIDEVSIHRWQDMTAIIRSHPGQPLLFTVRRGVEDRAISITPEEKSQNGERYGAIGVGVQSPVWPADMKRHFHYSVFGAAAKAVDDVAGTTTLMVVSVKKLLFGQLSVKNISGPLAIANIADDAARDGLQSFVTILALLSISLGVMNLLPVPVLDGGHMMYFLVEAVTGKPVSLHIQEIGFRIGLALILGLTALAFYNDIMAKL